MLCGNRQQGMGNQKSVLVEELPEIGTWKWSKVEEIIEKFTSKGHRYGLEIGDVHNFLGVSESDAKKLMDVLSLSKTSSINGAVVVTAIILVVELDVIPLETRKRALFTLVDYNHLQKITIDELEILLYCVGLSTACLLRRKDRTPRILRIRELNERAMRKLGLNSRTSYMALDEYLAWSVEVANCDSTLNDVYEYFLPSPVVPIAQFVEDLPVSDHPYPNFTTSHTSLMRQFLTPELFEQLKLSGPTSGSKLMQCIQSGVEIPSDVIGMFALGHESYIVYSELVNPVLASYHKISMEGTDTLFKSNRDSSELERMNTLDYDYITSSRIHASRNIKGYVYSPVITQAERLSLESSIMRALDNMKGEFAGTYWSIQTLEASDEEFLSQHNLLLSAPDAGSNLAISGVGRDWPSGRGVFSNKSSEFAVWVNGTDHVSVISQNVGGDISSVFEDWITAINGVERCLMSEKLEFDRDDRIGYLTTSLSDVGCGFHASMTLKLPKLGADVDLLNSHCSRLGLKASAEGDVWRVTTRETLGRSEVEITQGLIDGIADLITAEKSN